MKFMQLCSGASIIQNYGVQTMNEESMFLYQLNKNNLIADEKGPHHLIRVVVWVIYLHLIHLKRH